MRISPILLTIIVNISFMPSPEIAFARDQPQWGEAWSRNMVSSETGLPDSFDPKTKTNIKWVAEIGTESHSTPVVANGRVYIGTNNGEPRDPKHRGDRGVLMCFDEQDGHLLWQLVVPKRDEDPYMDWPKTGISSPVTVEGDRVYLTDNRGTVLCLDARGLANGNDGPFKNEAAYMTSPTAEAPSPKAVAGTETHPGPLRPPADGKLLQPGPLDADILWTLDLPSAAGIWPHDGAHSSILIHGDHLYLNTATGVDNTHKRVRAPDAPSLVVINKRTGQYLARDNEHIAPNIFHCTWSSPSLGEINGRPLIFFAGGDGIVHAFEPLPKGFEAPKSRGSSTNVPATLKTVWKFDPDPTAPKENVHRYNTNRREGPSNIYGMPVFHRNRIYVAGGGDIFWGKNEAWLKCIDATQTGDITKSGEIWSCTLDKHVLSTPAIHGDLLFIADCGRKLRCLEMNTGKPVWTHDINGDVWASPMVADGKVYLGTRSGAFYVLGASREKHVLSEIELGSPISATVTAANGTLYVSTMTHLYALQKNTR
ncbi:MAG: pyrrolo-quinoline quinone [Pedosphaera sp.]|nr:pyrrolo-quinoline quinone [Pedosphaera sp.]